MKPIVLALTLLVAASAQAQVTVKDSEFDSKVRYFGPDVKAPKIVSSDDMNAALQVVRDKKTDELKWGVLLTANYYGAWRYYTSASLSGGKQLTALSLGRDVLLCSHGSCSVVESAAVILDADDVRAGNAGGLKMRWNAERYGSFEIEFPAAQFAEIAAAAKR